jgi:hypothetical protein
MTYGRFSGMLAKHIKCFGSQPRKISSFLRPVKDDLGLTTPGVYSVPCEYGQVYIGQIGKSLVSKVKEHHRHIRLGHPDKSAVVEHSLKQDRLIKFQNTRIFSTVLGYINQRIREATDLELQLNNMKREDGLSWRGSLKLLFLLLIERRWPPALVVTNLRPR